VPSAQVHIVDGGHFSLDTAVETAGFQSLAANHATAGGTNEQFLKHLVEHGVLTRVSEVLDGVLHRIGVES
jgi:hypothetical protein